MSARPAPDAKPKPRVRLPWWKKLGFSLLTTFAVFVTLELVLALFGVRPLLYDEDPYVGFASYVPLFEEQTDSAGQAVMATAPNKLTWFNEQRFLRDKPAGTYRIFCLGGSTTYGRPYDDATSFSGWLREFLAEADPSRRWEVINAGGISYASYRVAKLLEEDLVEYGPDLIIIYSGHNEFLERRTYAGVIETPSAVRNVGGLVGRSRTYTALKRLTDAVRDRPSERDELSSEVRSILDDTIGPEAYHRDEELRRQVVAHYRFNLHRMIDIARASGSEVVLVTPASNLRSCSPF
ncbi:MAG: SGNH/GDSL hydrolase family protein [Planctomycetaceae bacterium]